MVIIWIRKMTGVTWPVALMRVFLWLALCLLIGALTPAAVAAQGNYDLAHQADRTTATVLVAQPTTYRYAAQLDGTSQVQRSVDGGHTWMIVGMIPEPVAQLELRPASDGVVFARTATGIWHSADGGESWTRVTSLPGRPLALVVTGADGSDMIFAGTDAAGLFSSMDSGTTWQAAGGPLSVTGVGSLAVGALALNPTDEHIIYAATTFSLATPEGFHSTQHVFISVNDGRRWFAMTPASLGAEAITGLVPVAGRPLAVSIRGFLLDQVLELQVTPDLVAQLNDADAVTRAAVARALGLSGDSSLVSMLLSHMHDSDILAGDQVAEAIGRLGDPSAQALLLPALSDSDEAVRARAAHALGLLHSKDAIPQLRSIMLHDGPLARSYAADALAAIGTPEAMAALTGPLQDAELTPARYAAMHGLEMAGQAAITPLRLALTDNNPVVRRNATEMLGWLRAADAVPDLARLLSDQDVAVRTQANWALGEMNTAPAQMALRQLANGEAGRPILQTASTEARTTVGSTGSERQNELPLQAALPGVLAGILLSRWTLGALATLVALAILAAMVMLIWKGPRQHLRPS